MVNKLIKNVTHENLTKPIGLVHNGDYIAPLIETFPYRAGVTLEEPLLRTHLIHSISCIDQIRSRFDLTDKAIRDVLRQTLEFLTSVRDNNAGVSVNSAIFKGDNNYLLIENFIKKHGDAAQINAFINGDIKGEKFLSALHEVVTDKFETTKNLQKQRQRIIDVIYRNSDDERATIGLEVSNYKYKTLDYLPRRKRESILDDERILKAFDK